MLPLIPVPFFFQDLEATDFLCRNVAPRNAEMRRVELQFQQPLKQASGMGVRPRVVQIIELAVRAAIHSELPATTLRAGSWCVCILGSAPETTLSARYIVGIRAAARSVHAAIAQLLRMDGSINQQPERDRMRPLIRR